MGFNPIRTPILFETPELVAFSAWIEHVPFGMLLVDLLRPRVVVELGTLKGVSYCGFCQAVEYLHLPTRCYAVDTWRGDEHAGHFGDEVLHELRAYHDARYSSFSQLVQMSFDDAAPTFADGSIDLLHIDGYHTYEAVRHDFETWAPKMSERGVVVFHDIAERTGDFGVWKLWAELSARYPTFEFQHGHGLGVVCVGTEVPERLRPLLALDDEERFGFIALCHQLGKYAEELQLQGENESHRISLEANLRQSQEQVADLEANLQQAQRAIADYQEREGAAAREHEAHVALVAQERELRAELADRDRRLRAALAQVQALAWVESSRGVHAIQLARSARYIMRQRGPVHLAWRIAQWVSGKRGLGTGASR